LRVDAGWSGGSLSDGVLSDAGSFGRSLETSEFVTIASPPERSARIQTLADFRGFELVKAAD